MQQVKCYLLFYFFTHLIDFFFLTIDQCFSFAQNSTMHGRILKGIRYVSMRPTQKICIFKIHAERTTCEKM